MKHKKNILVGAVVLLVTVALFFSTVTVTADTKTLQAVSPNIQKSYGTGMQGCNRDDIIWDNGEPIATSNLYSSQLDEIYPFVSQVADDFHLAIDAVITDVHWWGGFWGGDPIDPIDFYIYIYADDGTGNAPTGGGMPDPSPTALATYMFPGVSGVVNPDGFYEYEVILDPPFQIAGCNKYWIAIQAYFPFPPQWGWANTDAIQLSPAVQGFPLLGTNFWTVIDPAVDMAFYLTGYYLEEPEPAICCDGELTWTDVTPGGEVTGTFEVCNCGDEGSYLNWQFESEPDWGTWEIEPDSGTELPYDECVEITVTVTAPTDKNKEFTGKIKMINTDNPDDYCEVDVTLTTPRPRTIQFPLLQKILEKFPNAFLILKYILNA